MSSEEAESRELDFRASTSKKARPSSFNTTHIPFPSPIRPTTTRGKGRRPCSHWLDSSLGSSSTQLLHLEIQPDNPFEYPAGGPHCAHPHPPVYNVKSEHKHGTLPILPSRFLLQIRPMQRPPPLPHHPPLPLQLQKMRTRHHFQTMSQPTSPPQSRAADWQSRNASRT